MEVKMAPNLKSLEVEKSCEEERLEKICPNQQFSKNHFFGGDSHFWQTNEGPKKWILGSTGG